MPDPSPPQLPPLTDLRISEEVAKRSIVQINVGQEIMLITADRARLRLRDFEDALKKRREWATPLGMFVAFVTALCSADFKNLYGISPSDWKALFSVSALGSGVWLVIAAIRSVTSRKTTIESVIAQLKQESTK